MRWAELDTGRNSVSPCTMPSSAAWRSSTPLDPAAYETRTLRPPPSARAARRLPRPARPRGRPSALRPLRMIAIVAAMNTVEYVPLMMPTIIANANPRSTSPPNRYSASDREERDARRDDRPAQRLVDAQVHDLVERLAAQQPRVLADAVEDDDRVVHRVADDRQHRRHDVQRQLVVEEREHREHDEDVVEGRDDRADREDEPESEGDVGRQAEDREERRVDALLLQVGADDRADDLGADHLELRQPGLLESLRSRPWRPARG